MVEPALTRPQGAHVRGPYGMGHAPMRVGWICTAVLVIMGLVSLAAPGRAQPRLMSGSLDVTWIHGAQDCQTNTDPPIQIHRYNEHTYMLRQNKCIDYEAPFLYLLFGGEKVFLQDTGATAAATRFPIRDTVQSIITQWLEAQNKRSMQLIVTHSHSHGDHIAGDEQFRGQPNTTVVDTTLAAVTRFFGITAWPTQIVTYDLGERRLDIIPVPGHEATHIAVYDRQTGILLTGDTLYPGRLYIRNWRAYKASISRLVAFSQTHPITHVLGTHIEMSNVAGRDYPRGSTYQPQEHVLQLTPTHLLQLHKAVRVMGTTPSRKILDDFIIYPL